jgi:hypothetical protein
LVARELEPIDAGSCKIEDVVKMSGISRRPIIEARAGRSRPHRKNQERLADVLGELDLL